MLKFKERLLFMVLGGILTIGILVIVGWVKTRTPSAIARTKVQLDTYHFASTNFFAEFGRWPTSAVELASNSEGLMFINPQPPLQDGWGRQIVYKPYATNSGFGVAMSYGRDGKSGGYDADADIEIRFPNRE